ncbi:XFP N-terminal domain-containing protein [Triangularia verruculosa]|uniref:XFP N-terminal domain-containing protein n=1 Tax=Triangularia verruculosa TaxID=2587418 RepID=A0AAN7B034_9PEZI|nr:XFP N-terminal domain-containing protein [Triangularia verruculosa]
MDKQQDPNPPPQPQPQPPLSISPYGPARSTIPGTPLTPSEISQYNAFFKASLYLSLGMIYLRTNPLLTTPLSKSHLKPRPLGHFGSCPGQIFTYMHFNRLITKHNLNTIFISGPGHGAPAVLSQAYLEGTYSEIYPSCSLDPPGLEKFFKQFSFPGGIGSHATPETPGSLHEGGELGYSISHAFGAVFDNPDLIALTIVGDGEAETGPLATSWHSTKFLNPVTDGAVLPVLHLNGYKINNPSILARIRHEELRDLFRGYGWEACFVEGDEMGSMHQGMAATLEYCVREIKRIQQEAREEGKGERPVWPMVVLRSPKGWTGPRRVGERFLEGYWRSHQVPLTGVNESDEQRGLLEEWMRGYEPGKLFNAGGKGVSEELRGLCPQGERRMSANPVANGGGLLAKPLRMPDFKEYALTVEHPGGGRLEGSMGNMARFLRDVIANNPTNFRLFGPDETESNKLGAVYEVAKKVWMGEYFEEDEDGGNLAREGRVMEMLSEHTCEGWLEGYLLTGRHGLLNSYEPFIHVIDSMVNQHCKWLEKSLEVSWRRPIPSLNILLTAVVWRQDHNGFTHQDPGFLDVVANKSPEVVRIYLPPDGNCLLSVTDHCLRSSNYVNVIVADKQPHLQFLSMPDAVIHCTKGIGIWPAFSSCPPATSPDLVMASCGDISTQESIAAISLLLDHFPALHIRCVNVVDLFKLISHDEHPHGLTTTEYVSLFTDVKPVVFNFHSYPWLVYRLTHGRPNVGNMVVKGYREKGNIDTPLELAIRNGTDRFSLAMEAIDRLEESGVLKGRGGQVRDELRNEQLRCQAMAFEEGVDPVEITGWTWPRERERGLWGERHCD